MATTLAPDRSCSCGTPNCSELGWPHEWNPVDCNDSCALLCDSPITLADDYVRWGSGYAHVACVEAAG